MAPTDRESPLRLELFLLGRPEIRINGESLGEQPPIKGQALLFYLASTRKTVTREALSGLFWGEMDDDMARANLRLTLSRLHKLVGPCLIADRREVRCDFDRPIWVDVHVFEASLSTARAPDSPAVRAALNLYRNEFLHDFPVSDAPDYEMWVLTPRERLHQLALNGLQTVLQADLDAGRFLEAINTSRRMLDLEPWHEEAHRRTMWLLSVTDQRSAALAQYESCCRILDQELGVPPAEETTALYEKIKLGRPAEMPDPVKPTAGARRLVAAPTQIDVSAVTSMPAGQRFVGRAKELTTLRAALLAAIGGNGQQMFVVGGAGRGKSSLIREFVRRTQAELPELLIAMGRCTAREGIGDPYLPFHEILHQLTGDVRATGSGVMVERVQAGNLSRVASITIPLLVEEAPDLIGSFVPAQQLLDKGEALGNPDSPWLRQLAVLANSKQSAPLEQPRLFIQIAAFLASVAARLQEIYASYVEGFDSVDLRGAKALLAAHDKWVQTDR